MGNQVRFEELLAAARAKADQVELLERSVRALPVSYRGGALESAKSATTTVRALRIINGGRVGFAITTDTADKTILVENALQSAKLGDAASYTFPGKTELPLVKTHDEAVERLNEKDLMGLGDEVVMRLRSYSDELEINADVTRETDATRIANSAGLDVFVRGTALALTVEAVRAREGDVLNVFGYGLSRRRSDVDAAKVAARVIGHYQKSERETKVKTGTMPVVFAEDALYVLFAPLMNGFNGRYIGTGASPLKDKLGQQVFDRRFGLYDDGCLDYAVRSGACDDEGTPARRTALVEKGVVRGFLYDLTTGGRMKVPSTGNGFRGGSGARPGPMHSTWVVPPGERPLADLLRDLDEALVVYGVMGLGSASSNFSGEFSNLVMLGFVTRRGEIVGRVKNTMIAGNCYELLSKGLVAVARDGEPVGDDLRIPPIVIDGVKVVSS
jgi:PmbA protein